MIVEMMRLRWIALEKKIERRVKVKTRDAITRKREGGKLVNDLGGRNGLDALRERMTEAQNYEELTISLPLTSRSDSTKGIALFCWHKFTSSSPDHTGPDCSSLSSS